MRIQTLISTMNRTDVGFLNSMNIETDVVVGNQNGRDFIEQIELAGRTVYLVNSSGRGLSKNRNITVKYSDADICVLADDDIEYCKGYANIIESAFCTHPDADLIVFNLFENPIERHVIKKTHRIRGLEFLRYGSVRIAFKRDSIYGRILFDERFGAGGEIPIGEDTIFLGDCLKAGLKAYACPQYILSLKPSESTWFKGFDESYFINKGKMYYRIFGRFSDFIILQDAFRHRRMYSKCGNPFRIIKLMKNGKKDFKNEKKN